MMKREHKIWKRILNSLINASILGLIVSFGWFLFGWYLHGFEYGFFSGLNVFICILIGFGLLFYLDERYNGCIVKPFS